MQPTTAVRIETADPRDPRTAALLDESARAFQETYPEPRPRRALAPNAAPRWSALLLALDGAADATALGCGALHALDGGIGEVRQLFVRPAARRQGVAASLLGALISLAERRGCASVRLVTGLRQPAALALYAQFGFVRIPPFDDHGSDPTAVCFAKPLAPERTTPCSSKDRSTSA